ncbi:MAG: TolC family protein [Elusimicrobia bacterium]|nr:TolC family protein [Elusimicrobiota bacterium]
MLKTSRLALILGLFPALLSAQSVSPSSAPEKVFTLDDARHLALLNDARLLTSEQDKIIAEQRVKEARFLFLPEFGLQASATKFEARYPFSLSGDSRNILLFPDVPQLFAPNTGNIYSGRSYMHMPIYEGRKTINTLRLAQAAQKQAYSNYDSVRMDVTLEVKQVFYRLILAQEKVLAAETFLENAQEWAASSSLDSWEKVEAEALSAQARAEVSEARHQLDLSRLAFLKSLNIELDTSFKVAGTLETKPALIDIDKAVLWAMELRPELQSETYRAQMDAISVSLASARRIPTVFLAGDYELTGTQFPLRRNNWDATLGIRIPFAYDYWSQLKQKRAEQRQGELKRAELQDRVRLEVRQAYETLEYWQKEWPMREAQFRKIQALYDSSARRSGPTLGRIRAGKALLDLRLAYLSSVMEHILAKARLARAVGREISQ